MPDDGVLLWVCYPVSKARVQVYGRFMGLVFAKEGMATPTIILLRPATINGQRLKADSALMVDPRALIYDPRQRQAVYDPRRELEQLPAFAQEYLEDHPEWPDRMLRNLRSGLA